MFFQLPDILQLILLYFILGYSFIVIYNATKILHLSHAIVITIAPYLVFFLIQLKVSLYFSYFISLIITILIGILTYLFFYKNLLFRLVVSWKILIVSLGIYIILQNLISLYFGDDTKSFRTWEVKAGHQILGAYITDVQIITLVVSGVLLFLSWLFIEKTKIGKQIKAVSSNPEMSEILGINKEKVILWSFALGSGLAAVAGILIAADTDMTPTMGFNWLLYAVIAMIIGGMGKMRYLLMGALLLATAQHLSAYYLDSKWMNATAFVILIAFLYFKPYGFSGKKLKKAEI